MGAMLHAKNARLERQLQTLTNLVDQYKGENHALAQKIKDMQESGYSSEREMADRQKIQELTESVRQQSLMLDTANDEICRLQRSNTELQQELETANK